MDNDPPKKISLDQASIINLKAELLRKQEEFRLKKLSQFGSTSDEYETNKTQSTWGKKKPIKPGDKAQTSEQASKDNEEEEDTDTKMLEKSKKMLEAKSKYYEEVIVGKKSTEEGDEELFLVDFDRKIEESTKQENLEPKLKLKREVDETAYNEELRQKWEKEARENLDKNDIHYADLRFDEIRNMGVGNYRFATDEETRRAQMEFFKNIQTESKMNRILNEIYKLKREKLLVERISKVKQRKLLKFGYTLEQINSIVNFQSDIEEIEQEISNLENVIKNPELLETKEDEGEDDEVDIGQERDRNIEFKRRKAKTREWDKPKLKEKVWKNQIEKLRTERNQEFAPPQSYNTKCKKSRAQ